VEKGNDEAIMAEQSHDGDWVVVVAVVVVVVNTITTWVIKAIFINLENILMSGFTLNTGDQKRKEVLWEYYFWFFCSS